MDYEHGGNIHKFLRESSQHHQELLDYSANINPLGLSPMGKANMLQQMEMLSHYPDPEYLELKEALSVFYKTKPMWLSVYNGAAEGMHEVFKWLKPKKALLISPSFIEYEKVLTSLETELVFYKLRASEDFAIDEDAYLLNLDLERPDLAVICTPNNPTGQLASRDFLEAVLMRLSKWKGHLAVDEAFIDFLPKGGQSMTPYLEQYDHLHIFKSLTKFFGVPGLRLGAVNSSNADFHNLQQTYGVPWRVNTFAEAYAKAAVMDTAYIDASRLLVEKERERVITALNEIPQITTYSSHADYLLCKVLEIQFDPLVEGLKDRGILIRDCSNYKGLHKGYFRVAIKDEPSNLRFIQALKEVAQSW